MIGSPKYERQPDESEHFWYQQLEADVPAGSAQACNQEPNQQSKYSLSLFSKSSPRHKNASGHQLKTELFGQGCSFGFAKENKERKTNKHAFCSPQSADQATLSK